MTRLEAKPIGSIAAHPCKKRKDGAPTFRYGKGRQSAGKGGPAPVLSGEFWLGTLLSIPIGVGTGLAIAPMQRWLDSYGKYRSLGRTKRMRADYEEAYYFFTYPHRMTHYFLNRAIELLRRIMFVGMAFGYWMLVKPTPPMPLTGWAQYFQWIFPLGLLFLVVSLSQEVNRLHAIYYRAEFFGQYREKVLKALPDLDKTPFATTQPPDFI